MPQLPITRPVSLMKSFHSPHHLDAPIENLTQALAETDLQNPSKTKKKIRVRLSNNSIKNQHNKKIRESEKLDESLQKTYIKTTPSIQKLFSSSGLDEEVVGDLKRRDSRLQTLVMGGGMGSNGGQNGTGSGWDSFEGSNHGRDSTDAYYQKMIEANPDNALLLGNYAKFLKEVNGFFEFQLELNDDFFLSLSVFMENADKFIKLSG